MGFTERDEPVSDEAYQQFLEQYQGSFIAWPNERLFYLIVGPGNYQLLKDDSPQKGVCAKAWHIDGPTKKFPYLIYGIHPGGEKRIYPFGKFSKGVADGEYVPINLGGEYMELLIELTVKVPRHGIEETAITETGPVYSQETIEDWLLPTELVKLLWDHVVY